MFVAVPIPAWIFDMKKINFKADLWALNLKLMNDDLYLSFKLMYFNYIIII